MADEILRAQRAADWAAGYRAACNDMQASSEDPENYPGDTPNPHDTDRTPTLAETITARILVMQRKNAYEGQHAPEILAIADEWTLDENPEWWLNEVARQKALVGDDADAYAEIDIDLPCEVIEQALYPNTTLTPTATRIVG